MDESYLKQVFQNSALAYQSLNSEGIIIDINDKWLEILGYTRSEVINKNFSMFLSQESKDSFDKNFQLFKEDGAVYNLSLNIVKSDRNMLKVSINGKVDYNDYGDFVASHCLFRETEELNVYEPALSEQYYQNLFMHSNAVFLVIDPATTRFVDVNRKACDFYGFSYKDMLNKKISDINVFNDDPSIRDRLKDILDHNVSGSYEYVHLRSDKTHRVVRAYPQKVDLKGKTYLFTIVHDITDKFKAKIALKKQALMNKMVLDFTTKLMVEEINLDTVISDFLKMCMICTGADKGNINISGEQYVVKDLNDYEEKYGTVYQGEEFVLEDVNVFGSVINIDIAFYDNNRGSINLVKYSRNFVSEDAENIKALSGLLSVCYKKFYFKI